MATGGALAVAVVVLLPLPARGGGPGIPIGLSSERVTPGEILQITNADCHNGVDPRVVSEVIDPGGGTHQQILDGAPAVIRDLTVPDIVGTYHVLGVCLRADDIQAAGAAGGEPFTTVFAYEPATFEVVAAEPDEPDQPAAPSDPPAPAAPVGPEPAPSAPEPAPTVLGAGVPASAPAEAVEAQPAFTG
jgi:hypothetical protein